MRSLLEYLNRKINVTENADTDLDLNEDKKESSKSFTFNFEGLDNVEETLKSLAEYDCCSVDGEKLTITISQDKSECNDKALELLRDYYKTMHGSIKRSSNESFAQKLVKFANVLNEIDEFIDKLNNPEEEE